MRTIKGVIGKLSKRKDNSDIRSKHQILKIQYSIRELFLMCMEPFI